MIEESAKLGPFRTISRWKRTEVNLVLRLKIKLQRT